MARPFVPIGTSAFISLLVFGYLGFGSAVAAFVLSLLVFITASAVKTKRRSNTVMKVISLCCISVMLSSALFCLKTSVHYQPVMAFADKEQHDVTGTIIDLSEYSDHFYYTINVSDFDGNNVDFKLRALSYKKIKADTDDVLTFRGMTVYKLGSTELSQKSYKANGVYIGGYGAEEFFVEKAEKHSLKYYFNAMGEKISCILYEFLPEECAATAKAMLTGDKSELDDEILLNFRYSGVAHILAVSGFHLSLWTGIITFAFDSILKKRKYIGNACAVLFVLFFMALTGFSKSVIRAGIMMLVLLFGKFLKYRADSLNSLFFALVLILFANPFSADSISLQMSFLSSFGIILFAESIMNEKKTVFRNIDNKFAHEILNRSFSLIFVSTAAAVFTLPVCMYQFGYFSLISPLTNLLAMIPAEIFIFLSGIGVLFSRIGFIAKPVFVIASLVGKYIIFITEKLSRVKWCVLNIDSDIMLAFFLSAGVIFIIIAGVFIYKNRRRAALCAVCFMFAFTAVSSVLINGYNDRSVTVSAENVGNGTSVVLKTQGKTVLIGCGGYKYSEYYYINDLNKDNRRQIDLLIIPRNKDTESLYAADVLTSYSVRRAVISQDTYTGGIKSKLPENTVYSNGYEESLSDELKIMYINNDNFTGARIVSPYFTCTVIFKVGVDFSYAPPSWSSGDLLITRSKMPYGIDGNFKNVFISTNLRCDTVDGENIYSTKESGKLTFFVSPDGKVMIKEEKR